MKKVNEQYTPGHSHQYSLQGPHGGSPLRSRSPTTRIYDDDETLARRRDSGSRVTPDAQPILRNVTNMHLNHGQRGLSNSPVRMSMDFESQPFIEEPAQQQVVVPSMTEDEIRENHAYEWGFGKNLAGELGFGVKKNAVVPAFAIGLRDFSTK